MKHKKIKLQEPIYELQQDEKPKQHYFVDLYYEVENDNINAFAESFTGLKKGQEWIYSGSSATLLFEPYAPTYLIKLFSCLQVKKRRDEYWKDMFKSKTAKRKRKITEYMDTFADDVIKSISELKGTENEIKHDNSRPHLKAGGKKDLAIARKYNWEILKDLGDIEDPTKKLNVNADVDAEVKTQSSTEIRLERMQELAERMENMEYD